jgi:cobalt-zinc-cadmium efflux system membrane fusion protein
MTWINARLLRMPIPAAFAVSLGLLVSATGCRAGGTDAAEAVRSPVPGSVAQTLTLSAEQIQHAAIRWAAGELTTITNAVETPGQLVPDEDLSARLSAPARGRVVSVHVNVGDRVSAGQALVTVQSQEAALARADSAKAVAELISRKAAANYALTASERAGRLLELKAMSRQEMERARTDAELAQAAQTEAEAEVERARAVLTHLGVDGTGAMVLRTPLAGVVLKREVAPGSVVDAGAPLVTVADLGTLWLQAAATESVAAALRPGAGVQFRVPAFPGDIFNARVQNVGAGLDATTRTLLVRAVVRNESGRLRPEMFATVWIGTGEARTAVSVPEGAIQLLDGRTVVFVAQPDANGGARFERRDIEVGTRTGGQVQIVKGLAPGDAVVIDGAFAVKSEFARSKIPSES